MKFKKTKITDIRNQSLDDLRSFLKDNFADKVITSAFEFIEKYISDLETEQELTTTLAEQERNVILEKTHYGE